MSLGGFFRNLIDRILPELYEFNPFNLHPKLATAVAYCNARQWRELSSLYENLDHFQAHFITDGLAHLIKDDTFFDGWCEKNRGYYLPHLLRGALLLKRAWIYRGYGRGEDVTDARAIKFYDTLEISFAELTAAANLDQEKSEASALAIRALMGLGGDWSDIDSAYQRMRKPGEFNFTGEINYLVASCEKWHGSHEKMFAFSRRTYANNSHPAVAGLIAEAHHEKYMYLAAFEEDEDAAIAYLDDETVGTELLEASRRLIDGTTDSARYETLEAHGYFAMIFSLAKRFDHAEIHFETIGQSITHQPWDFYDIDFLNHSRRKSLARR